MSRSGFGMVAVAGVALGVGATACGSSPVESPAGTTSQASSGLQRADIVWQDLTDPSDPGRIGLWHYDAPSGTAWRGQVSGYVGSGWRVRLDANFYGDGANTLLLESADSAAAVGPNGPAHMYMLWHLNGMNVADAPIVARTVPGEWAVISALDVDGDGTDDIVWQDRVTGVLGVWIMHGSAAPQTLTVGHYAGQASPITGATELALDAGWFDGSHPAVLMFDHVSNNIRYVPLFAAGSPVALVNALSPVTIRQADPAWTEIGVGKLNADGTSDVAWYNPTSGQIGFWLMTPGTGTLAYYGFAGPASLDWKPIQVADYDGDGRADVLWHNSTNTQTGVWRLNVNAIGALAEPNFGTTACPWHLAEIGTHEDAVWECAGPAPVCNGSHAICIGSGTTCCDPDQTCAFDNDNPITLTACCVKNGNLLTGGACEQDSDCCAFTEKGANVHCEAPEGSVYKRCLQCRGDGVTCKQGSDCCSTLCDPGSHSCYSHMPGEPCDNEAQCGGNACVSGVCVGTGGAATCVQTDYGSGACRSNGDCCDYHLGHANCHEGICQCNSQPGSGCDPSGLTGIACCPGMGCLENANNQGDGPSYVCGQDSAPPICSGDVPADCGG